MCAMFVQALVCVRCGLVFVCIMVGVYGSVCVGTSGCGVYGSVCVGTSGCGVWVSVRVYYGVCVYGSVGVKKDVGDKVC